MLRRFPQSDLAEGGQVTANDSAVRTALLDVDNANKRERWSPFEQLVVFDHAVLAGAGAGVWAIAAGQWPNGAMLVSAAAHLQEFTHTGGSLRCRLYAEASRTEPSAGMERGLTIADAYFPTTDASGITGSFALPVKQSWVPPLHPWTLLFDKDAAADLSAHMWFVLRWSVRHTA